MMNISLKRTTHSIFLAVSLILFINSCSKEGFQTDEFTKEIVEDVLPLEVVDSLTNANIKYVLYSVSMFWVEVVYNAETNKIIGISSFIDGAILNKFSSLSSKK